MPKVIAMAGKGGTGKTTISALLINYLLHSNLTPVLAVDADANANLNELLDMDVNLTLGEIRSDLKGDIPAHITRDQFMEMKVHQALIEAESKAMLILNHNLAIHAFYSHELKPKLFLISANLPQRCL